MHAKRPRGSGLEINFWPGYTDIGMLMILILMLFLFIQIAFNSQVFKIHDIRVKQSQVEKKLLEAIRSEDMENSITIEAELDSQKITFKDMILFDSGKADLKEDGQRILQTIGKVLLDHAGVYASLRIEGHTDNVPLDGGGKFRSNWDLSSSRATVVVEFLNKLGLDPAGGKLYAAGYSEFSPKVNNDTDINRGRNRRIEMIINYKVDDPQK